MYVYPRTEKENNERERSILCEKLVIELSFDYMYSTLCET